MVKDRWITLFAPEDDTGRKIDEVVRAAKVHRADALKYFADNHLADLAGHFKSATVRDLNKWDG